MRVINLSLIAVLIISGAIVNIFAVVRLAILLAGNIDTLSVTNVISDTSLWVFFVDGFLLIVLNPKYAQQTALQLFGIIYVQMKKKSYLNEISEYGQKNEYILPFQDEWLVVNGGLSKETSHSWSIPSQRYAYDFFIINMEGKSYSGSKKDVRNYRCYGCNVVAPADGVVIETNNSCCDSIIIPFGLIDPYVKNIIGNYITIEHANKEYSLLAHLKKDSISVVKGTSVRQGEIIAQCGNTGNSSEPHLHYQIQDSPNFFMSCSLPVRFNGIEVRSFDRYSTIYKRKTTTNEFNNGYITRGFLVKNANNK